MSGPHDVRAGDRPHLPENAGEGKQSYRRTVLRTAATGRNGTGDAAISTAGETGTATSTATRQERPDVWPDRCDVKQRDVPEEMPPPQMQKMVVKKG